MKKDPKRIAKLEDQLKDCNEIWQKMKKWPDSTANKKIKMVVKARIQYFRSQLKKSGVQFKGSQ